MTEELTLDIRNFRAFWFFKEGSEGMDRAREMLKRNLISFGYDPEDTEQVVIHGVYFPRRQVGVLVATIMPYPEGMTRDF